MFPTTDAASYRRSELVIAVVGLPLGALGGWVGGALAHTLLWPGVLLVLVSAALIARALDALLFLWVILDNRAARVLDAERRRRGLAVLDEATAIVRERGL